MKMTKKSQSMSLNTVVIAAIVVLVLIVLSFIVIRYMGNWSGDLGDCVMQQGKCATECGEILEGTENYPIQRRDLKCPPGTICCLRLSRSD
jgi:hypothetical protein